MPLEPKPSECSLSQRKTHKPPKPKPTQDPNYTIPNTGDNPPNGETLQKQLAALQKSSDGKGIRAKWWGGGKTKSKKSKQNKKRKTMKKKKRRV